MNKIALFLLPGYSYEELYGDPIGTKVRTYASRQALVDGVKDAVLAAEIAGEFETSGQAVLELPEKFFKEVRCGVGRVPSKNIARRQDLYKLVDYRGEVDAYLDRNLADIPSTTSLRVVIYNRQAFLADPELTAEDKEAFDRDECTHALITFLASTVEAPSPLSSKRLVRNMAGGNPAYTVEGMKGEDWDDLEDSEKLERAMSLLKKLTHSAQAATQYESEWCTVA
jgi:hypothetical protein